MSEGMVGVAGVCVGWAGVWENPQDLSCESERKVGAGEAAPQAGASGENGGHLPWTGQQPRVAVTALPECPVCSRGQSLVPHTWTLQCGHGVCSADCAGVRAGTEGRVTLCWALVVLPQAPLSYMAALWLWTCCTAEAQLHFW